MVVGSDKVAEMIPTLSREPSDQSQHPSAEPDEGNTLFHTISQLRPGTDLSRELSPTYVLESQSMLDHVEQRDNVPEAQVSVHPVKNWTEQGTWPPRYSDPDFDTCHRIIGKRSLSNLDSQGGTADVGREVKSRFYKDTRYEALMAQQGVHMGSPLQRFNDTGRALCKRLMESEQPIPKETLFRDDIFKRTCDTIRTENEARVVLDIMRLIVPSAEHLAAYGATGLDILKDKVNSAWPKSFPIIGTQPQPDYSVGFREPAFTKDQVSKLAPFVGKYNQMSFVMARKDMYFPFLTCEVKCGKEGLNVADRQNMHSASVAVAGIVQLFRRVASSEPIQEENVKILQSLHQTVLAFSISHDHQIVRIYGHYALIDGDKTNFYRHLIRAFDFTELDGKEKWAAYRFTRNVYDIWVPKHLEMLRSAIDRLPFNFKFVLDEEELALNAGEESESEALELQGMVGSTPSSQGTGSSKEPNPPLLVALQNEVDQLEERMKERKGQSDEEMDEQKDRIKQLMGQIEVLKRQGSFNSTETMLQREHELLKRQVNEQREKFDLLNRQMSELMDLLKQKAS